MNRRKKLIWMIRQPTTSTKSGGVLHNLVLFVGRRGIPVSPYTGSYQLVAGGPFCVFCLTSLDKP